MAILWKIFTGGVDKAVQEKLEANPSYRAIKKELEADAEQAATVEKVSIVIGLTGIFALTALAVKYFEADRAVMGGAVMAATVPLSIFSYDCYQAAENLRSQVLENHAELILFREPDNHMIVNQIALRKCLLKGTVFFEPALGLYCAACVNSLKEEN